MTNARNLAHLAHFMPFTSTVNTTPENASTTHSSPFFFSPFFPQHHFATRPSIRTSNIRYIMANVVRFAKPGNRWGPYELFAFNINIVSEEVETFGNADLPQLTVSSVVLNNLEEPAGPLLKSDMDFFAYLEDAMVMNPDMESPYVADFVAFILKMMHYDEGRRVVHSREEIGFEMCGEVSRPHQMFVSWSGGTSALPASICSLCKKTRFANLPLCIKA